jgi:cell division protein FtsB
MFEFMICKEMKRRRRRRRILTYLLALLTNIVKILQISGEQGRVVTTLNIIKH